MKIKKLSELTGFSERHLRGLAKEGYYPPPNRGVFDQDQTLKGLFRYLKERATEQTDGFKEERRLWMRARRQQIELDRDESLKRLISIDDAIKDIDTIAKVTSAQLNQSVVVELPSKVAGGLDEIAIRELCTAATNRALAYLRTRQAWYTEAQKGAE